LKGLHMENPAMATRVADVGAGTGLRSCPNADSSQIFKQRPAAKRISKRPRRARGWSPFPLAGRFGRSTTEGGYGRVTALPRSGGGWGYDLEFIQVAFVMVGEALAFMLAATTRLVSSGEAGDVVWKQAGSHCHAGHARLMRLRLMTVSSRQHGVWVRPVPGTLLMAGAGGGMIPKWPWRG
jgi:hypothetical protein